MIRRKIKWSFGLEYHGYAIICQICTFDVNEQNLLSKSQYRIITIYHSHKGILIDSLKA